MKGLLRNHVGQRSLIPPQIRRLSAVHALDLRGRGMSTTLASITNN